jgi:hypothetical protein
VAQDLLQQLQAIRAKSVTNLEAEHQRLLTDTLRRLEQEVVSITSTLPIQDGVLFNTRLAIEIRPKLQQAIEELYLKDVQTFINDYDKIAGTIVATYGKLPIPSEFKQITEADLVTIQQLKKIAFSQFQNLGNEFTNTLAQEIYQSTLVGKPFANVVQTIRDKINGIYQQADTVKREELVNFIQDQKIKGKVSSPDVQTAIDELKQTYGSTVTGDNLYSYSSQIVGDALMGFDGQFAKYRADEIGLTSFIYYGSIIRDSRDFCVEHVNKIFTEDEARDIWLKDWQGKSGSDPFLDRGGYNCRHHWQPVSPDWGTINSDGTFDYTTDSTTTTFTQPPQPVQTNIPIVPPIRTTRAVAAAPEIFGSMSVQEAPLLPIAFGTTPTGFTNGIKNLKEAPLFQIRNARPHYDFTLDRLQLQSATIETQKLRSTFTHEYTHRLDMQIAKLLKDNVDKQKIFIPDILINPKKGVGVFSPAGRTGYVQLSNISADAIMADRIELVDTLKIRSASFKAEATAINSKLIRKESISSDIKEIYKSNNFPLSELEVKTLLKANNIDYDIDKNGAIISEYLLTIKHKVLLTSKNDILSYISPKHTQGKFADFVGAITDNKIGYGHSTTSYYPRFDRIIRPRGYGAVTGGHTLEAFAEYGTLINSDEGKIYEKLMNYYAPRTNESFKQIVEGLKKI